MDLTLVSLAVFAVSLAGAMLLRRSPPKEGEVQSQFVITGTILVLFYIVCFFSGICTILNFLFRWIF